MRQALLLCCALAVAAPAQAKTYEIDSEHSGITFTIRHLVSKVRGRFDNLSGTFDFEPGKPDTWKAQAEIEAASINTNVSARDKHLRGEDFFDVEKCPKLSFKSTKVTNVKGKKGRLHGEMGIHCVTKPVVLDLEIGEEATDPWGNVKFGAQATGAINRKDFGLNWNKALEAGGVLVGDEVLIEIMIEASPKGKGG